MKKQARSKHTKAEIAERLNKGADRLFSHRSELREDYDILQEAYDDATGLVTKDMYGDEKVKATKDAMHKLDQSIGEVARQMEALARGLKGK